jgi:cytochrome c-type biogenesis protein CcmH/NrfF
MLQNKKRDSIIVSITSADMAERWESVIKITSINKLSKSNQTVAKSLTSSMRRQQCQNENQDFFLPISSHA